VLLAITIKPKANYRLNADAMLLYYILQKRETLTKVAYFL